MRVFLAGATGVVGEPLCRQLRATGHHVTALTRTESGAAKLRAMAIEPVVADALDEKSVVAAMAAAAPEAVIHQLTAIPARMNPRRVAKEMAATSTLRTEGTRILLAGARAAGAKRFIAQSIAFALSPEGASPAGEDPIWLEVPGAPAIHRAVASLEEQVTNAEGIVGIALRFGSFYGPRTVYAPGGSFYEDVMRRRVPIVGQGTGVFSFIHVDDAAAATLSALSHDRSGIFNIVDDEPAKVRDWLPYYAQRIGAPPPRTFPTWLARIGAGAFVVHVMTKQRGASNARARAELGWSPRIASWRTGFASAAT